MFHWVNSNQLPLTGIKLQVLRLIGDLFGGQLVQSGKVIWNPSMRAKKLTRVLIMGKAVVGEAPPETPKKKEEENEFDMDSNDGGIR